MLITAVIFTLTNTAIQIAEGVAARRSHAVHVTHTTLSMQIDKKKEKKKLSTHCVCRFSSRQPVTQCCLDAVPELKKLNS